MKNILFIVFLLLFFGCDFSRKNSRYSADEVKALHLDSTSFITPKTDSLITVDLNPFLKKGMHFGFSDLIKSVKYVPLETTDESLIGGIDKLIVSDSHIYIKDNLKGAGIVIFDRMGQFIKRLPYGKGPGEIYRVRDMAYDKRQNELVVYQHPYLMFYTSSGEYLRQKKLPFGFHDMVVTADGYLFKTARPDGNLHLNSYAYCTLLVTDKQFKLEQAGLPRNKKIEAWGALHYLYNNGGSSKVQVTQEYRDTIYEYSEDTHGLKAVYKLNFEDKKLPETEVYGQTLETFKTAIKNHDYYFFKGDGYLETNTCNLFVLLNTYIQRKLYVFRNKKSRHLVGGDKPIINAYQMPVVDFPLASYKNAFISTAQITKEAPFITKSTLLSREDKLKLKQLTNDDNPVLVFFELKDF